MATVNEILTQMLGGEEENTSLANNEYEKIAQELNSTPEEIAKIAAELEAEESDEEAEKIAEEAFLTGRFMAQGFMDELNKIAMGPTQINNGEGTPQDGSVTQRVAESIANFKGQKQTPNKAELKAALRAKREEFMAAANNTPNSGVALDTNDNR